MAKLYFRYGTMGSDKTANAIRAAYNYEQEDMKVLFLKPRIENRDGEKIVRSRIGVERECEYVEDFIKPNDFTETQRLVDEFDCILVDEAQFCTVEEIDMFAKIVALLEIPVLCYGLRTDFLLQSFPAAARLLAIAHKIEKYPAVCWCGKGAECNARFDENGEVMRSGNQVELGGNEKYIALCMNHYYKGNIGPKMRWKLANKKASPSD